MGHSILLIVLIICAKLCLLSCGDVKSNGQTQPQVQTPNTNLFRPKMGKQKRFGGSYNAVLEFENLLKGCEQIDVAKLERIVQTELPCKSESIVNPLSNLTTEGRIGLIANLADFHGKMVKMAEFLKTDLLGLLSIKTFVQKIQEECNPESDSIDGRTSKKRKVGSDSRKPRFMCFTFWACNPLVSAKKETKPLPTTLQGWISEIQSKICGAKSEFRQDLSVYKTVLEMEMGTDPTFSIRISTGQTAEEITTSPLPDNMRNFEESMRNAINYLTTLLAHFLDSELPQNLVNKINHVIERTMEFCKSIKIDTNKPIWGIEYSYQTLFVQFEKEITTLGYDSDEFVNNHEITMDVMKALMKVLRIEQQNMSRYAIFNFPSYLQDNYLWNGALNQSLSSLHEWIIIFEDRCRYLEAIHAFYGDEDLMEYEALAKSKKCQKDQKCKKDVAKNIESRKQELASHFMPKFSNHPYSPSDIQKLDMGLIAVQAMYHGVAEASGSAVNYEVYERIGKAEKLVADWFANGHCATEHPHVNILEGNSGDIEIGKWLKSVNCTLLSVNDFCLTNSNLILGKQKNYWTNKFEEVLIDLNCWREDLGKLLQKSLKKH